MSGGTPRETEFLLSNRGEPSGRFERDCDTARMFWRTARSGRVNQIALSCAREALNLCNSYKESGPEFPTESLLCGKSWTKILIEFTGRVLKFVP